MLESTKLSQLMSGKTRKWRIPEKVSASFYQPDHASNPKSGSHYLRHIGLLGAKAPAVKGLKDVSFCDGSDDAGIVDLAMEMDGCDETYDVKVMAKTLFELLSKILPDEDLQDLIPNKVSNFIKNGDGPEPSAVEFSESVDTLSDRLNLNLEYISSLAESVKTAKAEKTSAENGNAIEVAINQGRLAPFMHGRVLEFMEQLDDDEALVFSESGSFGEETTTLAAQFRNIIMTLPPIIQFGEVSADDASSLSDSTSATQDAKSISEHMKKAAEGGRNLSASEAASEIGLL